MYPHVDKGATPCLKLRREVHASISQRQVMPHLGVSPTLVEGRSLVSLDLVKAKVLRSDLFSLYSLWALKKACGLPPQGASPAIVNSYIAA